MSGGWGRSRISGSAAVVVVVVGEGCSCEECNATVQFRRISAELI